MPNIRPLILLLDDEVLSLETLSRILDEEFEVRTATHAAAAEQILEEEPRMCDPSEPISAAR